MRSASRIHHRKAGATSCFKKSKCKHTLTAYVACCVACVWPRYASQDKSTMCGQSYLFSQDGVNTLFFGAHSPLRVASITFGHTTANSDKLSSTHHLATQKTDHHEHQVCRPTPIHCCPIPIHCCPFHCGPVPVHWAPTATTQWNRDPLFYFALVLDLLVADSEENSGTRNRTPCLGDACGMRGAAVRETLCPIHHHELSRVW